jgi:hypothetical protein
MLMKTHILAALREHFDQWEAWLGGLSYEQYTTPRAPSALSIKDELAHLWTWQQRSIARVVAAAHDHEPNMPNWPIPIHRGESAETTDRINAWIFESQRDTAWEIVHEQWRTGYLQMLAHAATIEEHFLLDSSRYAWMEGYSIAMVLVSSYEHHQEHFEQLVAAFA